MISPHISNKCVGKKYKINVKWSAGAKWGTACVMILVRMSYRVTDKLKLPLLQYNDPVISIISYINLLVRIWLLMLCSMSIQLSTVYPHVYKLFMYSYVFVFIYFVCLHFSLCVINLLITCTCLSALLINVVVFVHFNVAVGNFGHVA
jgi:hypothetical protein